MKKICILIPGEPVAQTRPRTRVVTMKGRKPFAQVYNPKAGKASKWRKVASQCIFDELEAMRLYPPVFRKGTPVAVDIRLIHGCPKSRFRTREPAGRAWRASKPDLDNVVKAVLDACQGLLWDDDSQVACLLVEQFTGSQSESARVEISAGNLKE